MVKTLLQLRFPLMNLASSPILSQYFGYNFLYRCQIKVIFEDIER
ncbi:hypothetical protein SLEP1_g18219 [Rubroshorea leprosula]|uniref:Uncharacterized protein n=1 Tax=Rubroshorea leprosula TaxID=152421 RepID=A0AAV5J4F0_9ROSI|nr:hypothetical protein SLEP1_g18219 [Rubroshorea leprosula]